METKKKTNYWLVAGAFVVIMIGGYYSYKEDQAARKYGVYTIAEVEQIRIAKRGWRVWLFIAHENQSFHEDAIYFYEYFSSKSVGVRHFIKINYDKQQNYIETMRLVPTVDVPDSIKSAPAEGWSEDWMREHFPEVVEYVHDTR